MKTAFVRPGVIGSILCLAIVVTCSLPSGAKTAFQEDLRPVSAPNPPQPSPTAVEAPLITPVVGSYAPPAAPWSGAGPTASPPAAAQMNCTCVPVSEQPIEPTVENLIVRLAELKKQKANIEKAEGVTTALLKEKLRQQRQRLNGLGVTDDGPQKGDVPPAQGVPPLAPPGSTNTAVKTPIREILMPVGPAPASPY